MSVTYYNQGGSHIYDQTVSHGSTVQYSDGSDFAILVYRGGGAGPWTFDVVGPGGYSQTHSGNGGYSAFTPLYAEGQWYCRVDGGSWQYFMMDAVPGDTQDPTATLMSAPTVDHDDTYYFTVRYQDDTAIQNSRVGDGDVRVTGPNGYDQLATLYTKTSGDTSPINAIYTIPSPGGQWDYTDNGTYALSMVYHQVRDIWSKYVPEGALGSFSAQLPTPPALSIADASITEGDTGSKNLGFTVTLSPSAAQTVTVNYATADGTATAGSDYTATNGSLTFTAGTTTQTIYVPILGDYDIEGNETFTVALSGAVNAIVGTGTGTGTIQNDDVAGTLALNASSYTVNENGGDLTVTVKRTGGLASGVAVSYATADGTAKAGSDYTFTSGTLAFSGGETSRTFNVPIINDSDVDINETFNVSLSSATGGSSIGSPSSAVVTIKDDDPVSTILGDFSGNGYVDQGDYTTWADNFGQDKAAVFAPGSYLNPGKVEIGDYTTWADYFGSGTPPMTLGIGAAQSSRRASTEAADPAAVVSVSASAPVAPIKESGRIADSTIAAKSTYERPAATVTPIARVPILTAPFAALTPDADVATNRPGRAEVLSRPGATRADGKAFDDELIDVLAATRLEAPLSII